MIYLDHNATTPMAAEVKLAMEPFWCSDFGNASSVHRFGQRARQAIARARAALSKDRSLRATLLRLLRAAPFLRTSQALAAMAETLGAGRQASVSRELTKRFEETRRGRLGDLAAAYADSGPPKGEIVVVVGPPVAEAPEEAAVDAALLAALGRASLKDAVAEVADALGLPRREVYARALALTRAR